MKKLNFASMLVMLMALVTCFSLSSCSDDDENDGGAVAKLCKTWYLNSNTSITFKADGTGTLTTIEDAEYNLPRLPFKSAAGRSALPGTRSTREVSGTPVTVGFTYTYDDISKQLTLMMEGETMLWTIVTLTDDVLEVKDEDGDTVHFSSAQPQNPEPPIDDNADLKGRWGYAGLVMWEFDEDSVKIYNGEDYFEKYAYRCNNRIVEVKESNEWWPAWKVEALTNDILGFSFYNEDEGTWRGREYVFRILDEPNTVGDASLLYGRKWSSFDDWGLNSFTFESNGTGLYTDADGSYPFTFTYDATSHKLTMETDGEKEEYKVVKLTEKSLIFQSETEDGVVEDVLECRVLDM